MFAGDPSGREEGVALHELSSRTDPRRSNASPDPATRGDDTAEYEMAYEETPTQTTAPSPQAEGNFFTRMLSAAAAPPAPAPSRLSGSATRPAEDYNA